MTLLATSNILLDQLDDIQHRLLTTLRSWPQSPEDLVVKWADMRKEMGEATALALMSLFDALDEILRKGSWVIWELPTSDEPYLTRLEVGLINLLETSQTADKDKAHREALFFVRPLYVEKFVSLIAQVAFIFSQIRNRAQIDQETALAL